MAIDYINTRTSASSTRSIESTSSKCSNLSSERSRISQSIETIENSIAKLTLALKAKEKSLNVNLSMLKNVKAIVDKFGKDASVRLKGNTLKYGQPSGFFAKMFHGSRYQTEREAAIQKFSGKGSEVSASTVSSILKERISNASNKLDSLELSLNDLKSELAGLNARYFSVDGKIREEVAIEKEAKRVSENHNKQQKIFATLYQTNAGAKALNAEARYQFGNGSKGGYLRSNKVIAEYIEAHEGNIFTRGNSDLKLTLASYCGDVTQLVSDTAKALYTPSDTDILTYRGQGMTENGFVKLLGQFLKDTKHNTVTTYKLGQFFSTSTKPKVAMGFARRSKDDIQIMFRLQGNSSNGVHVDDGLAFKNKEHETLYSPLANFQVVAIKERGPDSFRIDMIEVPRKDDAELLPY